MPVGVVRLGRRMRCLSSAVYNGGAAEVSAIFIMQVRKNYDGDPTADAERARTDLGLPEDSIGMMTAAEVRHVFNVKTCGYNGIYVEAVATAGLSNHVVAGEVLDDYDEKSEVSERRSASLAGTINICVISPIGLTTEGMVNLMIPLVEAKSVALSEHGFMETGTTSDSMAVLCPIECDQVSWAGTGTDLGIATARAVTAAVGCALDARNEHPSQHNPHRLLGRLGLDSESLRKIAVSDRSPDDYRRSLDGLLERDDVSAMLDLAWAASSRTDSLAEDGDMAQLELITSMASNVLGVGKEEGSLMDRIIAMLARAVRWQAVH